MRAMVCDGPGQALRMRHLPVPSPGPGQLLVKVVACGVCRTDLHVLDGELPGIAYPVTPGHEVVGTVERRGVGVTALAVGARIGVPWLGYSCGLCADCREGRENLCATARFHGYTLPGGYADYMLADARYAFALPALLDDVHSAPLMCAGLIGQRALNKAGHARKIGLFGFGAAAHLICQVCVGQGREVYALTRPGDTAAQAFARELGAVWAGDAKPPCLLDAVLIFAPAGELVPLALSSVRRGGAVVCAGIHMSDIPSFPYALLWGERRVESVANLTRQDALDFLAAASTLPLQVHVRAYPLADANRALDDLRHGRLQGAAVLVPGLT
ncbi:zinc-dependent alcohol dehydrogenase family protein [Crenobacter sp. HX-7-9]|uniref:Zinc-dependent alcohol dehydrogenase family protein n=2 Tax=Crenobacter caeni TaxID=2705474 RepID=A0A6B2KUM1_9NEIS|nr:zinc-dependent alcohol dehydrogenase family protein [Crenobacter caeni]